MTSGAGSAATIALWLTLCVCPTIAAAAPAAMEPQDTQVKAGQRLFEASCVMCHGLAGVGGRGPTLANRDLSLAVIRDAVQNGRPGTGMPPFKNALNAQAQAGVIAYVLWLASNGNLPVADIAIAAPSDALPTAPSSQPLGVGKEQGTPARGAALFFDPTRIDSCHACHDYGGVGGGIGPDFAGANGTPLQVYRGITHPRVAASGYPAVSISMRDGTRVLGIKGGETDDAWLVFDVSSVPPVMRTLPKSEVSAVATIRDTGIYDHTTLRYSKQDLLDLSAFLGKTDSAASR